MDIEKVIRECRRDHFLALSGELSEWRIDDAEEKELINKVKDACSTIGQYYLNKLGE